MIFAIASEMRSRTNGSARWFAFLLLLLGLVGCAGQSTQSEYVNPSRTQNYNAEERSYEKPWPFGDVGNGH